MMDAFYYFALCMRALVCMLVCSCLFARVLCEQVKSVSTEADRLENAYSQYAEAVGQKKCVVVENWEKLQAIVSSYLYHFLGHYCGYAAHVFCL